MKKLTLAQVKSLIKKNECVTIRLVASKMSPTNSWGCYYDIEIKDITIEEFEKSVNSFSYYNCNTEMGKRVNYYLISE